DVRNIQKENAAPAEETRPAVAQSGKTDGKSVEEQSTGEGIETSPPEQKLNAAPAALSSGNKIADSQELARYIQSGLVRGVGGMSPKTAANRGVKRAAFVVLLGAAMPSVLAEISFVSNPHDEDLLKTDQFRDRIAVSLFAGLRAYLNKHQSIDTAKPKKKA
ncbi:MAG TPA: N-acetylmuramoyl-L-alanine amidase, partial [Blastocatellia bacterium]